MSRLFPRAGLLWPSRTPPCSPPAAATAPAPSGRPRSVHSDRNAAARFAINDTAVFEPAAIECAFACGRLVRGQPTGAVANAMIGTAGGTLNSPNGPDHRGAFGRLRSRPPGDLQEIGNHAHGRLGRAWRITPAGLNAPQPMTLRFRYSDAKLLGIAAQAADGTWKL